MSERMDEASKRTNKQTKEARRERKRKKTRIRIRIRKLISLFPGSDPDHSFVRSLDSSFSSWFLLEEMYVLRMYPTYPPPTPP